MRRSGYFKVRKHAKKELYGGVTLAVSSGNRSPAKEGTSGCGHFSEVPAFGQISEALRRLLSVSVESQRSLVSNNLCTNSRALSGSPHLWLCF